MDSVVGATMSPTGNAYEGDFSPSSSPVSLANVTVTVARGPVVSIVFQRISDTLVHAVRLFNCTGCGFLESEVCRVVVVVVDSACVCMCVHGGCMGRVGVRGHIHASKHAPSCAHTRCCACVHMGDCVCVLGWDAWGGCSGWRLRVGR